MSNKMKIKGPTPLLTLEADREFAKLETTDPVKAFELLYEFLRSEMTQASVVIVMAVERLRSCDPEIFQKYFNHILHSLMLGAANNNLN